MTSVRLVASLTPDRHCFVALPREVIDAIIPANAASSLPSGPTALLLEWGNNRRAFVGFAGTVTANRLSIGIPATFAACLSIAANELLRVTVAISSSPSSSLTVEPVSSDDWEILSLNAAVLEFHLLEQIQIIDVNSTFPFYVTESQLIHLRASACSTANQGHARLILSSQLIVAPKARDKTKRTENADTDANQQPLPRRHKLRVQDWFTGLSPSQPVEIEARKSQMHECSPSQLYVSEATLLHMKLEAQQLVLVTYRTMRSTRQSPPTTPSLAQTQSDQSAPVSVVARVAVHRLAHAQHALMSPLLQRQLGASSYHRIIVSALHPTTASIAPKPIQTLTLRPLRATGNGGGSGSSAVDKLREKEIANAFLSFVHRQGRMSPLPVLATSLIRFPVSGEQQTFQLTINEKSTSNAKQSSSAAAFNGSDASPWLAERQAHGLRMKLVQPVTFYLLSDPQPVTFTAPSKLPPLPLPMPSVALSIHLPPFEPSMTRPSHLLSDLGGLSSSVIAPVLEHLLSLINFPCQAGSAGLLIGGDTGTSKSLTVRAIAYHLFVHHRTHVTLIQGRDWKDDKREMIIVNMRAILKQSYAAAPSLIVIDDIDLLLPAASETDHQSSTLAATALASELEDLILTQRQKSLMPVAFLVTAASSSSHHPVLSSSLLFPTVLSMPSLSLRDRADVLTTVMKRLKTSEVRRDVAARVSERMEGYRARDIEQIVTRAIHAHLHNQHQLQESVILTMENFDAAFVDFVPSSLKDLPQSAPAVDWADIGGLWDVKSALKDTLELPSKFAPLFDRVPIKLRSGVLLYGPPGTGKTLLATAIASHCNLPLISVKGPELLNKYIGSSEAAVRGVFERARSCAPCVLFFDEMEAIATKRGGESTGVTDRVVNQFLCELDGVEGGATQAGKGRVFLLAASSRPDLIDPALLRPGRIDKTLYCHWPNQDERHEILTLAVNKLKQQTSLKSDIDNEASVASIIAKIAGESEGFTGADLHAIVTNAQLELVHQQMNILQSADSASAGQHQSLPALDSAMLLRAFESSSPSVSPSDRHFFTRLYSRFIASKEGPHDALFDPSAKQKLAQA